MPIETLKFSHCNDEFQANGGIEADDFELVHAKTKSNNSGESDANQDAAEAFGNSTAKRNAGRTRYRIDGALQEIMPLPWASKEMPLYWLASVGNWPLLRDHSQSEWIVRPVDHCSRR